MSMETELSAAGSSKNAPLGIARPPFGALAALPGGPRRHGQIKLPWGWAPGGGPAADRL